jgi:hypothetical protein
MAVILLCHILLLSRLTIYEENDNSVKARLIHVGQVRIIIHLLDIYCKSSIPNTNLNLNLFQASNMQSNVETDKPRLPVIH